MKERPILFSGQMVNVILSGRKTVTRRVIKPQPPHHEGMYGDRYNHSERWAFWMPDHRMLEPKTFLCPFGEIGNRLWVRESWGFLGSTSGVEKTNEVVYHADGQKRSVKFASFDEMIEAAPKQDLRYPDNFGELGEWRREEIHGELLSKWWERAKRKPSIHMPRWASRITLEITGVGVERLQDITEEDARAEGVTGGCFPGMVPNQNVITAREDFRLLWDSINGKRGYSWESNPYVWRIGFRVVESEVPHAR